MSIKKILRKVIYISSLLTLGVFVFPSMGMMGMMGMPGPSNASANETWDCKCGKIGLTSKFCTECGQPRTNTKTDAKAQEANPNLIMLDGPGMANESYWKHEVLNGGWITPQGNFAMKISGFDCELGIYKSGEPDNFLWAKDRFYFAGWQRSKDKKERFDLLFGTEPSIKDANGDKLITIKEAWHENISIFMIVKFKDETESKKIELRKPETMSE